MEAAGQLVPAEILEILEKGKRTKFDIESGERIRVDATPVVRG